MNETEEVLQALQAKLTPTSPAEEYFAVAELALKLRKTGVALAYLEKAHSTAPEALPIARTLKATRSQYAREVGVESLEPGQTPTETFVDSVFFLPLLILLALAVITTLLVLLKTTFKRGTQMSLRATLGSRTVLLHALSLILLIGFIAMKGFSAPVKGVLIDATSIMSGPAPHFIELGRLLPGFKLGVFQVAPQEDAPTQKWVQVRFSPDQWGWVPESNLLLLTDRSTTQKDE